MNRKSINQEKAAEGPREGLSDVAALGCPSAPTGPAGSVSPPTIAGDTKQTLHVGIQSGYPSVKKIALHQEKLLQDNCPPWLIAVWFN
jgi:hypothetical protein